MLTEHQPGSKPFDTLTVSLKEFFEKVNFDKRQQMKNFPACKELKKFPIIKYHIMYQKIGISQKNTLS